MKTAATKSDPVNLEIGPTAPVKTAVTKPARIILRIRDIPRVETTVTNPSSRASALSLAKKGNEGLQARDPHTCCFCKKVCTGRPGLVTHLEGSHLRTTEMFCDLCPKVYYTKSTMTCHVKTHRAKVFACDICDYRAAKEFLLRIHKGIHNEAEECPHCKKQVNDLKRHLDLHKAKVKCPDCPKFILKLFMRQHKETHHAPKTCSVCSKTLENKEALRRLFAES